MGSNTSMTNGVSLTRVEKLEQERLETRKKHKESFIQTYEMTEKQADECLDAIELICVHFINDYKERKRAGTL